MEHAIIGGACNAWHGSHGRIAARGVLSPQPVTFQPAGCHKRCRFCSFLSSSPAKAADLQLS
eukprot:365159-Chlamydomonas_euryale.AAC.22